MYDVQAVHMFIQVQSNEFSSVSAWQVRADAPIARDWVLTGQGEALRVRDPWPKGPYQAMYESHSDLQQTKLFASGIAEAPNHEYAYLWHAKLADLLCGKDSAKALYHAKASVALRRSADGYLALGNAYKVPIFQAEKVLAAIDKAIAIDPWRQRVKNAQQARKLMMSSPAVDDLKTSTQTAEQIAHQTVLAQSSRREEASDPHPLTAFCVHCSKRSPQGRLLTCGRCASAYYCNKVCQKAGWGLHKQYCCDPATLQSQFFDKTKSPAHERVLDEWELPSIADIVAVFGPSLDITRLPFTPPMVGMVSNAYTREQYEKVAALCARSTLHYAKHNDKIAHGVGRAIRMGAEYRVARTACQLVIPKHSPWHVYCNDRFKAIRYEVFTTDYVEAFATYLKGRIDALAFKNPVILEVGAGDGRLSYALQKRLPSSVSVIATDDNSWFSVTTPAYVKDFQVKQLNYKQALAEFKPHIVICSWMPKFADWTAAFRACPSVREYILIGPAFSGLIGHTWLTWGGCGDPSVLEIPIFTREGFTRNDQEDLARMQLCMDDRPTEMFASQTVSFRREAIA